MQWLTFVWSLAVLGSPGGEPLASSAARLELPPTLPNGHEVASVVSPRLLEPGAELRAGVIVAEVPPKIEFLYYPGQDHPGRPWSNWGDGLAVEGKYYSTIGDHQSPVGTAQVYEYDPRTRKLRQLVDLRSFLESSGALAPGENYTSGKIHTRLDMGRDGWLYYAGHRGSTRTTDDEHGFRGERIYRTHPTSGETQIVAEFPVPKHVIPMGLLDPDRLIFYGGTAAGEDANREGVWFFAYDCARRALLCRAEDGPQRCAIWSRSTGKLYWLGKRYDPQTNEITPAPQVPHVRSATAETPGGFVYGTSERSADIWRFDVRTEKMIRLGSGAVATAQYVTTIDADPTGRYLYYVPGAHGRAEDDGTPVVQYDIETGARKVVCFLTPFLREAIGYTPIGTFGSALSPDGSTLYVTWNGYRRGAPDEWDVCALTVIHIPEAERRPTGRVVQGRRPFTFRDSTSEVGMLPHVAGIKGHAAGWGDADSDGWVDLYVGAFHTGGSKPNMLFYNRGGTFAAAQNPGLRISSRPTGSLFADFDNDADLDLYISSMPRRDSRPVLRGCTLFRNDGGGKFTDISEGNAACPEAFGGRSATVLDFDGDGLLDLLVGEDPLPGYNGSITRSSRLFHNRGGLQFEDATQAAGIPAGIPALGVAAGDVNDDGWPDVFLACHGGGNRLLLNRGDGTFREVDALRELFAWETAGGDNMVCGVCFGDVNRDGLADVVIGQHFERPWRTPVANRLYLNRGIRNGVPQFDDVTEPAGLVPLPMKAPHIEIQDFDNDGWPDIYTSIVKFADGAPHPVIFRNLGCRDGMVRFEACGLEVNDFPSAEDRAIRRAGQFFDKMVAEKKMLYAAAGPSSDFDRDGRLDVFLASWWPELNSLLLRNETESGHWLQVEVRADKGVNRMGIGSRVNVYEAGRLGDMDAFLGCREIATGYGYASSQEAVAHFGLGDRMGCDVEVVLPYGHGRTVQRNVPADQRITIRCAGSQ
jgi:hypothetical protein